jgi:hypothetical protein
MSSMLCFSELAVQHELVKNDRDGGSDMARFHHLKPQKP